MSSSPVRPVGEKLDMLRPGIVGVRGFIDIRLRPCMISSTYLLSSTPPPLLYFSTSPAWVCMPKLAYQFRARATTAEGCTCKFLRLFSGGALCITLNGVYKKMGGMPIPMKSTTRIGPHRHILSPLFYFLFSSTSFYLL